MIAGPDRSIETRVVLQPVEAATIRPTWDTLGLRASASHDVDFGERVEVPAWLTFTWPGLTVTRPGVLANATTTVAMISFSAAAVQLGAARRAVEVAVESAEQKRRPLEKPPLVEQAPFIRGFAGIHGRVELATAGLRHLLDELWSRACDGEAPDAIGRARLRLAAAEAVATGADVVRTAALLVGADATHRSHPLERLTRDSQMLVSPRVGQRPVTGAPRHGAARLLRRTRRPHLTARASLPNRGTRSGRCCRPEGSADVVPRVRGGAEGRGRGPAEPARRSRRASVNNDDTAALRPCRPSPTLRRRRRAGHSGPWPRP